jgi:SAM-dependent methyltransferase
MSGARGAFHGARQILQYNRGFYLAVVALGAASAFVLWRFALPPLARAGLLTALGAGLFWAGASLAVSHYVYDRSPLYRFEWLGPMLPAAPRRWANIHAGLDESSAALARIFPEAKGEVLDIYDPREMTERSIGRARAIGVAPGQAADFRALPLAGASCDAVLVIFCAHELRARASRRAFFAELRRVLSAGGGVILVEHLRDWANFAAFGPGCLHFQRRGEWLRVAREAGLKVASERRLTPFVRVFRLEHG